MKLTKNLKTLVILFEVIVLMGVFSLFLWSIPARSAVAEAGWFDAPDPAQDTASYPKGGMGKFAQDNFFSGEPSEAQTANVSVGTESVVCGPPPDWKIYQVRPEDSFESLSGSFAVKMGDFQRANCLGDLEMVVAGMQVFIPPDTIQADYTSSLSAPVETPTPTPAVIKTSPTQQVDEGQPSSGEAAAQKVPESLVMRDLPIERLDEYEGNPGVGWQYKGGSFLITSPAESVAYSQRSKISWAILNPAERVYDWSALEDQLQTAVAQGKQFSFRVYSMRNDSYGGHQIPQWVLDKGAVLFADGEPDYSNCTYQQEWGNFVNALIERYDGNPDIAFIDISGYGNYNEWRWMDSQTEWDEVWADAYKDGSASRDTMSEMDSFARRILADIFIGGAYHNHLCTNTDGEISQVSYAYPGFGKTQLLMPYGGIVQSSQYVFSQRKDIGFRHDCLGRTRSNKLVTAEKFAVELDQIWRNAPVVFETCTPGEFEMRNALYLSQTAHASLIHDVNMDLDSSDMMELLQPLGYQYLLKDFHYSFKVPQGGQLTASMTWQNIGLAPSYPKLGQQFELHVFFYDRAGNLVVDYLVPEDLSAWMPAEIYGEQPPEYVINVAVDLGDEIPPGIYDADFEILDVRTGKPIWVPFGVETSMNARN